MVLEKKVIRKDDPSYKALEAQAFEYWQKMGLNLGKNTNKESQSHVQDLNRQQDKNSRIGAIQRP